MSYSFTVVSLVIDILVYVTMLSLGIYFIYKGDVVQRFHLMRTNFMVYEEPIYEHPTIITWLDYTYISPSSKNVTFGKDFKIYYTPGHENVKNELTFGHNRILNSDLVMNFQQFYEGLSTKKLFPNHFKITPLNYRPDMLIDFRLTYIFQNPNLSQGSLLSLRKFIHMSLRAENNTETCQQRYNDGEVQRHRLALGTTKRLTVEVPKNKYLPGIRHCRTRPYIELLDENILNTINTLCDIPCKPTGNFSFCQALGLSKGIDHLPICKDENENQCFNNSYEKTQEFLKAFIGACTKVSYQITSDTKQGWKINGAMFHLVFDPPRMYVQEEYLIFDWVATISAIGGTMGLCIGFSFTNFASKVLKGVGKMADKLKKEKVEDDRLFLKTEHFHQSVSRSKEQESITKKVAQLEGRVAKIK